MLRATGITKSFAGVRALQGASFDLRPGEVHALVGENGAGKSTLIRIIAGAETPDAGSLEVEGRAISQYRPKFAKSLGIAAIYQQPSLFPDLSVAENIALSLETGRTWRTINWRARKQRATELLKRAGASIDPERPASSLSMPEQQLVEISKAIGADARILIMDEPTASLTELEVERLFRVIATFRARGAGIVYVSHRLEEIFAIADRITVLRDGETVAIQLRIKAERIESAAETLSGGNQQKVALARWLATNPAVLILDEPTQGVDVGSKHEIHKLMVDLARSGMAILMISSELPEILGMSDRIAVMNAGRITGVLSRHDATPQTVLSLALGHE